MKKRKFTVYVQRDVFFEATVRAESLQEALEKAESMMTTELWDTPGDIMTDEHKITAVFE